MTDMSSGSRLPASKTIARLERDAAAVPVGRPSRCTRAALVARERSSVAAPSAWRTSRATPCSSRSTCSCASPTSPASSACSSRRWSRNARATRAASGCWTTTASAATCGWPTSADSSSRKDSEDWAALALPRESMAAHLLAVRAGLDADRRIHRRRSPACRTPSATFNRVDRHRFRGRRAAGAADAQPRLDGALRRA